MFLFGWGTKNKTWPMADTNKHLVATWSYFHLFWLSIGYNIKWSIIGDNRSEDLQITYNKVKEMFSGDVPKVNIWQRYGLLIVVGILGFFSLLGF